MFIRNALIDLLVYVLCFLTWLCKLFMYSESVPGFSQVNFSLFFNCCCSHVSINLAAQIYEFSNSFIWLRLVIFRIAKPVVWILEMENVRNTQHNHHKANRWRRIIKMFILLPYFSCLAIENWSSLGIMNTCYNRDNIASSQSRGFH